MIKYYFDNRDDKKQIIRESFDANYPIENQKNDFNIIVTTDTLSEGINLHRSNIIYNYDIPWNATKLIQRIGRVNRIGTKADFIYVHNFKPSSNIEKLIKLSQKAYVKLQAFHTTLGEDNKIYTENEEVSTVKLFNEYQKASKERDEELDFLEELREFRDKDIDEFNNIVNLPKELAVTTKGNYNKSYIVLEVDDDIRYYCVDNIEVKPISFLEIVKVLKKNKHNKIIEYKANRNHIENTIKYCKDEFDKLNKIKAEGKITKGVEQKTIIFIKKCLKNKILDKEQFKTIKNAIVTGEIDIITANDILKLEDSSKDDIISNIKNILDNIK
ncbi:MAG: helicase-related protein, partial [Campylobacterota bacterium]|nr:helicase-related protein [Campylobacterota bacterium]